MSHFFVIGSGLTGAVIARILADKGHKISIIERRNHIGGNLYDEKDDSGFLVQRYGPHSFHTNCKDVWDFVNRFSSWDDYRLVCGAFWDGIFTPTPFNFKTVDDFFDGDKACKIRAALKSEYPSRETITVLEALNSSNPYIQEYAEYLFANDYSLYTAKQWGLSAKDIDKSILERVPLRLSYDEGYFDDLYQALPSEGYTVFIENILDSANINIELDIDAKTKIDVHDNKIYLDGERSADYVIYTGALDELFNNCYGALPYRSLSFKYKHDTEICSFQKYPIVAYPRDPEYTRITEYTKLPVQSGRGTVYAYEYPGAYIPGISEPFYPVLTDASKSQYKLYYELASHIDKLVVCGRLGDFKYYNMDQAIARAFDIALKF